MPAWRRCTGNVRQDDNEGVISELDAVKRVTLPQRRPGHGTGKQDGCTQQSQGFVTNTGRHSTTRSEMPSDSAT
jgi:hypothetical protein